MLSRRAVLCAFSALGLSACGGGDADESDGGAAPASALGRMRALATTAAAKRPGTINVNLRAFNAYGMASTDLAGVQRSAW